MKRIGILIMILGLTSMFFASDIFFGVGADLYGVTVSLDEFELDELEINFDDFSGASVFTQVDLAFFTAQFLVGRYDNFTGDFYQFARPKVSLGVNFKIPILIFYLKGQVLSPLPKLLDYAKGFIDFADLYLLTRFGVGMKLSKFFVEAGMSSGSFVANLNRFNPFEVPYVSFGVAF
ncbi:hypothetical protein [Kosmotoga pacifica]|uniref:Uncharacterized protein n=1 Tax=Kosmotoga pacifica TaxID=1330330 RepID=A0A0G2Z967_9BACT|nr:hypothetical protein [Kosmotoga pacifica]AKI96616.1 hypothetical protein IX53_00900 [Kosmotoga pacifica]